MKDTNPNDLMEAIKRYREIFGNNTIDNKKLEKIIQEVKEERLNGTK